MADWARVLAELIDLDGDYPTREIAAALRKCKADGMREAAEMVRSVPPCPFDDDRCSIKVGELCPVCGENDDGINPKTGKQECKSAYWDICKAAARIERGESAE